MISLIQKIVKSVLTSLLCLIEHILKFGVLCQVDKGTLEVVQMSAHSSANSHDVRSCSWLHLAKVSNAFHRFRFASHWVPAVATADKLPPFRSLEIDLVDDVAQSPTNGNDVLSWIESESFTSDIWMDHDTDVVADLHIAFVEKLVPED